MLKKKGNMVKNFKKKLKKKLRFLKAKLKVWKKNRFVNLQDKISDAEAKSKLIQHDLNTNGQIDVAQVQETFSQNELYSS